MKLFAALLLMTVLGPLGVDWLFALCAAPLPCWLGPVLTGLRAVTFIAPLLWLAGVIAGLRGLARCRRGEASVWLGLLLGACLSCCDLERPRAQRAHWLEMIGDRGLAIVREIDQRHNVRGAYPQNLDGIDCSTGAPGYPRFEYSLDPEHGYELWVSAPTGGFNFDQMFYWPGRNYPRDIGGNPISKVGDWAYLNE